MGRGNTDPSSGRKVLEQRHAPVLLAPGDPGATVHVDEHRAPRRVVSVPVHAETLVRIVAVGKVAHHLDPTVTEREGVAERLTAIDTLG